MPTKKKGVSTKETSYAQGPNASMRYSVESVESSANISIGVAFEGLRPTSKSLIR